MKGELLLKKELCQKKINKLNNVCTHCGGELTPIKTVDNSGKPTFWIGCKNCQIFNNGTDKDTYKIAVRMVDERGLRAYSYEPQPDKEKESESFDYWRKGQISGAVSIISDVLRFKKGQTKG